MTRLHGGRGSCRVVELVELAEVALRGELGDMRGIHRDGVAGASRRDGPIRGHGSKGASPKPRFVELSLWRRGAKDRACVVDAES
jgi:hypothetical protein